MVSEVAPLIDTTGTGAALTMTFVLALAHAPRKLHSCSVTVLTLSASNPIFSPDGNLGGSCVGGLILM